jgi:predicted GH43/DUF377 family glycosyl hydrolase
MNINRIYCVFLLLIFSVKLYAQKQVTAEKMQAVYKEVKTPWKYGLVIAPKNDSFKIDCPTIFRKNQAWYMSYIQFNGKGYETWLAKSKDLLNWQTLGRILSSVMIQHFGMPARKQAIFL